MTCSNGQYNPNPLANPFNTRIYGNYSLNPCSPAYISKPFNSQNKSLPNPTPYQQQEELHTPTTDIPMRLADFQNIVDQYARNMSWNSHDTFSELKKNNDTTYWQLADKHSNALSANMSDEQQKLLNDIDKMFPTRFEEEN